MENLLGTAGGPMLNIINSKGLSNILVIVTRYFGGILLGTGGLVRAYSEATELALDNANIVNKELGIEAKFEIAYSDLTKLQYYFERNNIKILDKNFEENVQVIFEINKEKFEKILENKENFNFKILKNEILNDKYIEIIL